jgi:hypothetical protein
MRHNSPSVIKPKKEPLAPYIVRNYQVHFSGKDIKKGVSQWGIRYPEKAGDRGSFSQWRRKKKLWLQSGGRKKSETISTSTPIVFLRSAKLPTGDGGMFAWTWELQCRALPALPGSGIADHDDSIADANLSLGELDDP